jgi:thermosome
MAASLRQPTYLIASGTERTRDRAARASNVAAGKAVAGAVRSTLGPRGMDKMLVDSTGNVVVTNDGATILAEMDVAHPAAQMLVEVAKSQEDKTGDGTTTAAVLAGELLMRAEDLLNRDVHPTTVVEGYAAAADIAAETVVSLRVGDRVDDDLLRQVAGTSLTGKGTGSATSETLADLVVRAVRATERGDGRVEEDDVRVLARAGGSASETRLVEGVVIDKERIDEATPQTVEDARVAVVDVALDVRTGSVDSHYQIEGVDQLNAALEAEDRELRGYADALEAAGVDVLVSTKKVSDRVARRLADRDIVAFQRVKNSDARAIARATGARRLGDVREIGADDLGVVERVHVKRVGEGELTFIEGGAAAKTVTIFVRGGTEHVVQEVERAIGDAVDVVRAALREGVAPGAGATEAAVADAVRSAAASVEGRKQLAVKAFAAAVEAVPRILAQNAGLDPIDAVVDLRAATERGERVGIVVDDAGAVRFADPVDEGIIDPVAVKLGAVAAATEAATMIHRIDDVFAAA